MKTIKPLVTRLSMVCLLAVLLTGGCKKELADDSTKIKKPDLLLSKDGGPGKKKVLRQSPGLKIGVKGETIERISPTLKSIDKITSILNEEQSKKNQDGVMTTKSANFTASLAGTYYNCYAELNDPGPYDWYLINWNTGVYTYIGSSTDYINFNVQKPSMYGSYRVWGEGPYGAGFTGYQYMGDPYTGVSISSGILEFTDAAVFDALNDRLEQAYEDHSAAFYDGLSSLTDEQVNDYAESQGFDDLLPLKEFETFWGLSSLRQRIESEISEENLFPEANYIVADEVEGTLINQYGQYKIASNLITELYMGPPPTVGNCHFTFNKEDPLVFPDPNDAGLYVYERIWSKGGVTPAPRAIIKARHTKPGGGSRRYATRLNVKISGNAFQNNCINYDAFNSGWKGEKRRKRLRVIAYDSSIPVYFDWLYFHTGHATGNFTTRGNGTSLAY